MGDVGSHVPRVGAQSGTDTLRNGWPQHVQATRDDKSHPQYIRKSNDRLCPAQDI